MPRADLRSAAFAALLTILAAAPARAQAESKSQFFEQIFVEVSTPLPISDLAGWVPVRILIENRRETAVALSVQCQSGWGDALGTRGSVRLDAGATEVLQWLVPYDPDQTTQGVDVLVSTSDRRIGHSLELLSYGHGSKNERHASILVVGERLAEDVNSVSDDPIRVQNLKGIDQMRAFARAIEPADLPSDWRALSTVNLVVVQADVTLPAGALAMLDEWVRLGGVLLVDGTGPDVAGWFERAGWTRAERFTLRRSGEPDCPLYTRRGFGRVGAPPAAEPLGLKRIAQEILQQPESKGTRSTARDLPDGPFSPRLAGTMPYLPGVHDVPKRTLTLILILFALIVGPVQLHRLRSRPERTWNFLFFTPLVAIGFAALIVGFSIMSQGVTKRDAWTSVTWLHQDAHQASALFGRQIFAGTTFGGEPRLPSGGLVLPAELDLRPDDPEVYHMVADRGGALAGAWLPARIPVTWRGAWSGSLRAALEVRPDGAAIRVTSGFDVSLAELHYCDASGKLWRAEEALQPGASLLLVPAAEAEDFNLARSLSSMLPGMPPPSEAIAHFSAALPRGCWRARAASAPWLPDCGVAARTVTAAHWVIGELPEAR